MEISEKGIKLIQKFEGFRSVAYQDSVGVWTIGYGSTKGVKKGDVISEYAATERMKSEIKSYYGKEVERIASKCGWSLNSNQFDALVSFTYNLGVGNLETLSGIHSKKFRTLSELPIHMKLYNKADGKVEPGLVRRRKAEIELFNTKDEYK